MIIAKNLSRLFITLLITTTITTHQLHAMKVEFINSPTWEAEFQTYKLLSAIDNPDYCLLPELVQIIAINVSKLIDKDCYEAYGACLIGDLFYFIRDKQKFISNMSVANIVKRCLRYSGKSISNIKYSNGTTIFHMIIAFTAASNDERLQYIKIALLIAEKEAWNILCMKNAQDYNAIFQAIPLKDHILISELLSAAPNREEAWRIIITPNKWGINAIKRAERYVATQTVQLFESYRPKEQ